MTNNTAFTRYQTGESQPGLLGAEAFGHRAPNADIQNRLGYHKGNEITIPQHEKFREAAIAFGNFLVSIVPAGPARDQAVDRLQEACMWANFGIAAQAPLEEPRTRPEN